MITKFSEFHGRDLIVAHNDGAQGDIKTIVRAQYFSPEDATNDFAARKAARAQQTEQIKSRVAAVANAIQVKKTLSGLSHSEAYSAVLKERPELFA
jgi:hypothetical protein